MTTTYEAVRPLEDGKPVPVCERDESGALVGAWIGYWSFKRGTVALYPDVRNKFVNWPGGRVPRDKRIVSDRYVKIRNLKSENRNKSLPSEKTKVPKSQTGAAMKEILGQEKIKFEENERSAVYGKRKD